MPVIKQNRVTRQYPTKKPTALADFFGALKSALEEPVLKPVVQTTIMLQFEDTLIQGELAEVEALLPEVPTDETPQHFTATVVTSSNPQRHFTLQVLPGVVAVHLFNATKPEAEPVLRAVRARLPEEAPPTGVTAPATEPVPPEDLFLPGPFRPIPMPKIADREVFVIMAFQREHRDAYNLAIKPTLKALGFHPVRIDEVQHNATVTPEILRHIERSTFVVADLTGERPNVYYEVGYAHRANKEVILVARKGAAVHFDVSAINRIEYDDFTELVDALDKRIRAIAERHEIPINTDS